jgi:predicted metalloprotease
MRWESEDRSDNVEDRRGFSVGRGGAIGGGAIILAVVAALLGAPAGTVREILNGGRTADPGQQQPGTRPSDPAADRQLEFVKVILRSTETTWSGIFSARGQRYTLPKLIVFTDAVESACGQATAAVGPFYCPPDHQVYLDLEFFAELESRFGAPGDFARAYVVAHEIGHHVQNLLGIFDKVENARRRGSPAESNHISVLTELQADCLAGVWAYNANKNRHILEPGDAEAGLAAASAIGDDTLQKRARGRVSPESFTHGSSAQRVKWFKAGMDSGKIEQCDTFGANAL